MSKRTTVADIAAAAGVSTATVSRALTNPESLRPATLERVLAVVREYNFSPDQSARKLRTGKTKLILAVLPSIENSIYSHVLRGVGDVVSPAGYGVIIGNLDSDPQNSRRFIDLVYSRQVDGVLVLCGYDPTVEGRSISQAGVPVVGLCAPLGNPTIPDVTADDEAAALEAARYLTSLGHRRLAYAAGPPQSSVDRIRWTKFREGALAAGIADRDVVRIEGQDGARFSAASGIAAARDFLGLPRRPTAVFCASDEIAMGFIKRLREDGVMVPKDVSVVGFDGIEQTEYMNPVLTTFRQPREEIGRRAMTLLLDMIETGRDLRGLKVRLPVELLARESVRPQIRMAPAGPGT